MHLLKWLLSYFILISPKIVLKSLINNGLAPFIHCLNQWCSSLLTHVWPAFNTLRPRRSEQHFADDIFKRIFFNESVWISIKISLKFVPKGPINKIPALFQIMASRRPGDKPLSEAMLVSLLTHKCVTRPQCVNVSNVHVLCLHNTYWV